MQWHNLPAVPPAVHFRVNKGLSCIICYKNWLSVSGCEVHPLSKDTQLSQASYSEVGMCQVSARSVKLTCSCLMCS